MESSAASSPTVPDAAPGRPSEIELASNLYLIHPIARRLVDGLARTPVTPNQVSVASVFAAAGAAAGYVLLAWPFSAIGGVVWQIAWHVLDGADGDLARRTGRASPIGELVDGVCDHLSQALIYVAFAVALSDAVGPLVAWSVAVGAGVSHFVQANAYETGRKTYRRYVYGAAWMRQAAPDGSAAARGLSGLYLGLSKLVSPGEDAVEAAMGPAPTQAQRDLYRERFAPVIKASGWLSSNNRTWAAALSILAGSPRWFFIYELSVLNLAFIGLIFWRAARNRALVRELA